MHVIKILLPILINNPRSFQVFNPRSLNQIFVQMPHAKIGFIFKYLNSELIAVTLKRATKPHYYYNILQE